ncbi:MAG: 3,4-dihydroxy-2-butanone-4-phosphate synthase [Psychromonas sp.]|nr:3,4-dihydroxy-2-butanone-4-phosphate synthase [Psychromonas sp.]
MSQSLLSQFGDANTRVINAIESIKNGLGVLVVDDEDRENEGDFIFAADSLSTAQMAMMIREGSGIVCLCLPEETTQALNLPQMVAHNNSQNKTAYTVSIEAKVGVTTGVSAQDRVTTIKAAIAASAQPQDLARPGHVFPLKAANGGVLVRRGHTEAAVDLTRLAGRMPAGVICELTNPDGTMARLPEVIRFATAQQIPVLSIDDLVKYIRNSEQLAC